MLQQIKQYWAAVFSKVNTADIIEKLVTDGKIPSEQAVEALRKKVEQIPTMVTDLQAEVDKMPAMQAELDKMPAMQSELDKMPVMQAELKALRDLITQIQNNPNGHGSSNISHPDNFTNGDESNIPVCYLPPMVMNQVTNFCCKIGSR